MTDYDLQGVAVERLTQHAKKDLAVLVVAMSIVCIALAGVVVRLYNSVNDDRFGRNERSIQELRIEFRDYRASSRKWRSCVEHRNATQATERCIVED